MHIVMLAYPGVQANDIVAPTEVFAQANLRHYDVYRVQVVGSRAGIISSAAGIRLIPDSSIEAFDDPIDTLIVPGAQDLQTMPDRTQLGAWLRHYAPQCRRLGAIGNGKTLLAAAKLPKQPRAPRPPRPSGNLPVSHPGASADSVARTRGKPPLYTATGANAGAALALTFVEEDLGPETARAVAGRLLSPE
jgi:transcriptional regulator GlxA family with amidase domain